MRTFTLARGNDESGVSGTGTVLEAMIFTDGKIAGRWLGDTCSTVVWDSFEDFWTIHVASHPTNNSIVTFGDGEMLYQNGEVQPTLGGM